MENESPKCERTAYGFSRTTCGCYSCSVWCKYMPGFLAPDDLEPLYEVTKEVGEDPETWAKRMLRASPGGIIGYTARTNGKTALHTLQIPTLVPARKADGSCVYLTESGQCSVHAVSPFGCAFIDSHMTRDDGNNRSLAALHDLAIRLESANPVPYYRVWQLLVDAGLTAPSAAESRENMRQQEGKKT